MLREDMVYIDDIAQHVSLTKHENFHSFSDAFRAKFGTNYICDSKGAIATSKTGKELNLDEVLNMLRSKDAKLYEA